MFAKILKAKLRVFHEMAFFRNDSYPKVMNSAVENFLLYMMILMIEIVRINELFQVGICFKQESFLIDSNYTYSID